ncbi:MAG: PIN domain-containing protein [Acidimicrobiales bacterium]
MPQLERVFVDTATLYPISLADLVLRLAELGMFELLWSDHLLDEVQEVMVRKKGLTVESARYFCACIRRTFPEGRVAPEEYLPLVASRTGPDPDDHVHSAAAVAGAATVVLSADKTGYPRADIAPARRRDPDAFLRELIRRYPREVIGVIDSMGAALREPLTRDQVLNRLAAAGVPRLAERAGELD